MLLRFSVVSGHLPFVHYQIQLTSLNCTQITSIGKVKVCVVILVHDMFSEGVLGIEQDGGYNNLCKQQGVICVCDFVSVSFHHLLHCFHFRWKFSWKTNLGLSILFSKNIDSDG